MHLLLSQQDQLHADASVLLQDTLLPLLSKYGDTEVNGSYKYKLLYHPDIDIYIINGALTKQMYIDLCTELLSLNAVSKCKSADRVNFPHQPGSGRPTGYYISPTIHTDAYAWSCDIWFQKHEWVNPKIYRYDDTLTSISDEQRIIILTLKQELIESGQYGVGNRFESVDIYDVVLNNPAMSLEEVRKELLRR